jgi:hypothetical protein
MVPGGVGRAVNLAAAKRRLHPLKLRHLHRCNHWGVNYTRGGEEGIRGEG